MAKRKKKNDIYYLDTASLSVKKVRVSMRQRIFRLLRYLVVCVFLVGVAFFLFAYFFESPREKQLSDDLSVARTQYRYLNKRVDELNLVLTDIQDRDRDLYRMVFEAEPPARKAVLRKNYSEFKDNEIGDVIMETGESIDRMANRLYAQSLSFDQLYLLAKQKEKRMDCVPAIYPVNKQKSRMSSGFGQRFHPIYKRLIKHMGVDIACPQGTPVYATGDGKVTVATQNMAGYSGYGVVCRIDHGFGYESLYAHLSRLAVKPGQKVKRGDIVAYSGNTGMSRGPHLHYEVFVHGKHVNPVYYFFIDISPEEFLEIFEKSKEINQSLS